MDVIARIGIFKKALHRHCAFNQPSSLTSSPSHLPYIFPSIPLSESRFCLHTPTSSLCYDHYPVSYTRASIIYVKPSAHHLRNEVLSHSSRGRCSPRFRSVCSVSVAVRCKSSSDATHTSRVLTPLPTRALRANTLITAIMLQQHGQHRSVRVQLQGWRRLMLLQQRQLRLRCP